MSESTLKEYYRNTVVPQLKEQLGCQSIMEVPKIKKIVLNRGVGAAVSDKKILTKAAEELSLIAGQKAVITRVKKSIAGFKIREGWPIGCKVTLRRDRMYEFLERLLCISVPRIRDFRGLNPRSFDGQGNYSMGITEQLVFPEIQYDKVDFLHGVDITIATSARNNKEGLALLKAFNFPFRTQ